MKATPKKKQIKIKKQKQTNQKNNKYNTQKTPKKNNQKTKQKRSKKTTAKTYLENGEVSGEKNYCMIKELHVYIQFI